MGRIADTRKLLSVLILSVLVFLMMTAPACTTASWVVHHNSPADDLAITEVDVDAMIDELSIVQPGDSGDILYNETTNRYELKPDIFRKAVRDGIVRRIQDRKISVFLENYHRESFVDALRKDMGTAGAAILLLGILGVLFY